jgi:hypothetical protein
MYAAGKVRMSMLHEPAGGGAAAVPAGGRCHEGSFVVWQLAPGMWIVEMAVAGHSVAAGSDGRVAWRRTPWLGAHAARGGSRPLRRALQVGITRPPHPRTTFVLHSRARRRCHFCMSTVMPFLHVHRDAIFYTSQPFPLSRVAFNYHHRPWRHGAACLACNSVLASGSVASLSGP